MGQPRPGIWVYVSMARTSRAGAGPATHDETPMAVPGLVHGGPALRCPHIAIKRPLGATGKRSRGITCPPGNATLLGPDDTPPSCGVHECPRLVRGIVTLVATNTKFLYDPLSHSPLTGGLAAGEWGMG